MNDGRELHKYLCWLDQIKFLGRKSIFALLEAAGERSLFSEFGPDLTSSPDFLGEGGMGSPAAGARILYHGPESQVRFLCREAFSFARADKAARLLLDARKTEPAAIEEKLACAGISFHCFFEEDFPDRLRTIPDPPFGLYFRGQREVFPEFCRKRGQAGAGKEERFPDGANVSHAGGNKVGENGRGHDRAEAASPDPGNARDPGPEPSVAVIGARLASGYGREQARRFSRRLASRGITIISGMARGIDGIAQRAALDAGGKSCAVLGCGVDVCYPEENRDLYERLLEEGGILSEYCPGTRPDARLFPQRNRIISGLSDLVLVIEARKKSGTLITVDMALDQGREVYALPGRVSDSLSDGCNRLIRQGAAPATCPEDILEFFFGNASPDGNTLHHTSGLSLGKGGGSPQRESGQPESGQPGLAGRILDLLSCEDPMHVERILEEIQMPAVPGQDRDSPDRDSIKKHLADRDLPGETGTRPEKPVSGKSAEMTEKAVRPLGLGQVISCLTRLKIDGKIEEISAGYYRKKGEQAD